MTEQELFSKAYTVLRDRGFTRAGVEHEDGYFQCLYRSPVGPCAIGALVTDAEYEAFIKENDVPVNFHEDIPAFASISVVFLDNLQVAHDKGYTPERLQHLLNDFATEYSSEIPS